MNTHTTYRKTPIISPGLIFVQKAVLLDLFSGSLFSEGLIIGRNFAFQNRLDLTIKTARNTTKTAYNSLTQQILTLNGLIFQGLIIGRIFASEIWGLIFRRAYFWRGLLSEFHGSTVILFLEPPPLLISNIEF